MTAVTEDSSSAEVFNIRGPEQEMAAIKYVESLSRPGLSIIKIEMVPTTTSDEIPQVWDELRRKIRDIE